MFLVKNLHSSFAYGRRAFLKVRKVDTSSEKITESGDL